MPGGRHQHKILAEIIKVSSLGKPLHCLWPQSPVDTVVILFALPACWDCSEKQMTRCLWRCWQTLQTLGGFYNIVRSGEECVPNVIFQTQKIKAPNSGSVASQIIHQALLLKDDQVQDKQRQVCLRQECQGLRDILEVSLEVVTVSKQT